MDNSQTLSFLQVERNHQELSGGEALGRMVGGLAICIALVLVGVAVLKRLNKFAGAVPTRRLRIMERLSLSNKTSLVLVDVGGRELLISVGSESVTEFRGLSANTVGNRVSLSNGSDLNEKTDEASCKTAISATDAPSNLDPRSTSAENFLAQLAGDSLTKNNSHEISELDAPIYLDRPVGESFDAQRFNSKVLADQLIITNPYRH